MNPVQAGQEIWGWGERRGRWPAVTGARASRSGSEAERLPQASVFQGPETSRKLNTTAESWLCSWEAGKDGEGTWPGALYFTGGETEAQGGDRPTQGHKPRERQGPSFLHPHLETMPATRGFANIHAFRPHYEMGRITPTPQLRKLRDREVQ